MTIVALFLMISPLVLTFINIKNFISEKKIIPNVIDGLIFILGSAYTAILYSFNDYKEYNIALEIPEIGSDWHAPISALHMPTIIVLVVIGFVGYVILKICKLKLPPLMITICISSMLISGAIGLIWIVQLSLHCFEEYTFYFCLFPINYIICYSAIIRTAIKEHVEAGKEVQFKNPILNKCTSLLNNSKNWPAIAIILMIPILTIIILILTLFGQQPTAAIKAFTETSDWLLSKKISPPPIEVDAHYLCTVSLRGHQYYVKPLRYGIRHNQKIVVNRQLCVANAFEELIRERIPLIHRIIRRIYDKYGYPLSKHINNPISADIVYTIMKPLEWFFLVVLYLFDIKPEDRIARQYLPLVR